LKATYHLAYTLQHLEGASISQAELAFGLSSQQVSGMVQKAEQHPITHSELQVAVMLVIGTLGVLLPL
jgi:hypothetical protein